LHDVDAGPCRELLGFLARSLGFRLACGLDRHGISRGWAPFFYIASHARNESPSADSAPHDEGDAQANQDDPGRKVLVAKDLSNLANPQQDENDSKNKVFGSDVHCSAPLGT